MLEMEPYKFEPNGPVHDSAGGSRSDKDIGVTE